MFDGAMGTYYNSLPGRAGARCELASVEHPEEILSIHRAYLEAGARAIKTNTFALGNTRGGEHEEEEIALLRAACRLAQEAAVPYEAFIFADIGPAPLNGILSPAQRYCRLAQLFLDEGITHFLLETLSSDTGVKELSEY